MQQKTPTKVKEEIVETYNLTEEEADEAIESVRMEVVQRIDYDAVDEAEGAEMILSGEGIIVSSRNTFWDVFDNYRIPDVLDDWNCSEFEDFRGLYSELLGAIHRYLHHEAMEASDQVRFYHYAVVIR